MATARKRHTIEARYIGSSELDHVQSLREWHDWSSYGSLKSLDAAMNLVKSQASTCQRYEFRIKSGPVRKKRAK